MPTITKTHNGFNLEIEVNKAYRRILISMVARDYKLEVRVYQQSDENYQFTLDPVIGWDSGAKNTIHDARRFAQAIELAAVIAADIETWIQE